MKKIILFGMLFALFTSLAAEATEVESYETTDRQDITSTKNRQPKIQVAILLDTSGSMQGLIEQAKSRLWNIVNTLTTLKYKGKEPIIEIALYEYGSYHRYDGDYIKQITPLTTDLDLISQELFVLTTGGSEEFCGTVISRATRELEWSEDENDMKLIYIAGNETFEQGSISYKAAIPYALKKNIHVNTIHCGDRMTGIRHYWQDAANLGKGKYFNINANARVRYFETPFDDQIGECNIRLNSTYISYGALGESKKVNQSEQDLNAQSISLANFAERIVSKSKAVYRNSSWDLVDLVKEDKSALDNIKKAELPKELQNKSKEELQKYIEEKQKEREILQHQIAELAQNRQEYINKQLERVGDKGDDLGDAIAKSILSIAAAKGFDTTK